LSEFELDGRIARDSDLIATLDLCQLRIQNDSRWPWLVMVPQRADMTEIFELSEADQALLSAEVNQVAAALKKITGATKINVGALGNIVRQLHVHVIARFEGDANWPGPIWGYGSAEPYDSDKRQALKNILMEKLSR
jgi:diadenosine tetraphosphate (Ap4A) HIT family hydrolase